MFLADGTGLVLRIGNGLGGIFVPLLFLRQIAKQLADAGVGRPLRSGLVKAARFNFHQGRFLARVFGPERLREP